MYGRIDERISVFWLFSTIDKLSFDISIGAAIYVDLYRRIKNAAVAGTLIPTTAVFIFSCAGN